MPITCFMHTRIAYKNTNCAQYMNDDLYQQFIVQGQKFLSLSLVLGSTCIMFGSLLGNWSHCYMNSYLPLHTVVEMFKYRQQYLNISINPGQLRANTNLFWNMFITENISYNFNQKHVSSPQFACPFDTDNIWPTKCEMKHFGPCFYIREMCARVYYFCLHWWIL